MLNLALMVGDKYAVHGQNHSPLMESRMCFSNDRAKAVQNMLLGLFSNDCIQVILSHIKPLGSYVVHTFMASSKNRACVTTSLFSVRTFSSV